MTSVWKDVPDPRDDARPCVGRCEVEVEERVWRHMVEKHVSDPRQPWGEWLARDLIARFRGLWQPGTTEEGRQATLGEVSAILETEAKQCLGVPLALLFDNYQPPQPGRPSPAQETWNLVLPVGALLVVRSRPEGGLVTSCYFKGEACRATDPRQRWRALVRALLLLYAEVRPDRTLAAPDPMRAFSGGIETRSRVRFRTVGTWHLGGRQRRPWETIPDPWGKPVPPAAPRGLGPRRQY